MNLAPGKEIELTGSQPFYELKLELKPASLYGKGKFQIQYERIFGNSGAGQIKPDPVLSMLATGKLELEIKAEPPVAPEVKVPPVSVKVDPAAPAEIHGTQTEMRLLAMAKGFCVAMRNHHRDKNANALRKYIDPAYLKKHDLMDRDLIVPMLAVGALWNIEVADDGRTILCIVQNEANAKVPINEVLLLRVSDYEGKGGERYLLPSNAPDPKTGAFTPWILRSKIDTPAETGKYYGR